MTLVVSQTVVKHSLENTPQPVQQRVTLQHDSNEPLCPIITAAGLFLMSRRGVISSKEHFTNMLAAQFSGLQTVCIIKLMDN